MELIWQGTDITDSVSIRSAVHRDYSCGRSDCLDMELYSARNWYDWQPEVGDKLELTEGNYSTGTLFLNTVLPYEGYYRIIATSMAGTAKRQKTASYENMTLAQIMDLCAAECGMQSARFGVSDGLTYPYLIRDNMGAAEFLEELVRREGCALKCIGGKLTAIAVEYAQNLPVAHTIEYDIEQSQARYIDRRYDRWASVRLISPLGEGTATDSTVPAANGGMTFTCFCPPDVGTAKRWAHGILLMHNRQAETMELNMEYNDGLSAMVRVDIESDSDAAGEWLVDTCEHDFVNLRTCLTLVRCINGVS